MHTASKLCVGHSAARHWGPTLYRIKWKVELPGGKHMLLTGTSCCMRACMRTAVHPCTASRRHVLQYVETDMQQLQIKQRHEPRALQEQVGCWAAAMLLIFSNELGSTHASSAVLLGCTCCCREAPPLLGCLGGGRCWARWEPQHGRHAALCRLGPAAPLSCPCVEMFR